MDAASGVEEWSPQITDRSLVPRVGCVETLVTPIDCGNGTCCPLGSTCVPGPNGVTNCRGGVQGLGTAEVPGLTISPPPGAPGGIAVPTVPPAVATSVSSVQTGVSTSSTPEPSTVTQITTASISLISTETVIATPSPSSETTSSSSSLASTSSTSLISSSSSLSSSSSSSISLIFQTSTQAPAVSSGAESFISTLPIATTSASVISTAAGQNANSGAADTGSGGGSTSNNKAATGGLNVGAAVGIAVGVGVVAFIFVVLAFVLCVRLQKRGTTKSRGGDDGETTTNNKNNNRSSTADTERATATLPRGGEKTFSDVVQARQYDARSPSRASVRSNPFADNRSPEMTAIGGGGGDNRNYYRDSMRSYDRESDRVYDQARSRRDSDQRYQQQQTRRTSLESDYRSRRDSRGYSGRSYSPQRRGDDDRSRSRRSTEYYPEFDVPEPAATYLRDPFSSPVSSKSSRRRSARRSTSPRRYLYPEQTERDANEEEVGGEPAGEGRSGAESRAESEASQPKPVNYLPVFQAPVFAVLPGKSGAIVEMI